MSKLREIIRKVIKEETNNFNTGDLVEFDGEIYVFIKSNGQFTLTNGPVQRELKNIFLKDVRLANDSVLQAGRYDRLRKLADQIKSKGRW